MEWITENWITIVLGIAVSLHIYWLLSRHVRMGHDSHGHDAPPTDSEEKARGKPTSTGGACH